MAKQTNIQFKVDLAVDGKNQVAELGMALGDLENVINAVNKTNDNINTANAVAIASIEYAINAVNRLNSTFTELSKAYAIQ